jgi:hypothetical protein
MTITQSIAILTLALIGVLVLAQVTSPLAMTPPSTPEREKVVGFLILVLVVLVAFP